MRLSALSCLAFAPLLVLEVAAAQSTPARRPSDVRAGQEQAVVKGSQSTPAASTCGSRADLSAAAAVADSYIYRIVAHCPAGAPVYADIRIGSPQVAMPVCR